MKLFRYLPALIFGLFLAEISLQLFSYTPSYMLRYLSSIPNLTDNSIENLWLILHGGCLALALSALIYFCYRKLLAQFPDDLLSAVLIQLPIAYISLYLLQPTFDFSTLFSSAPSITSIVASVSVLLVYGLFTVYGNLLGSKRPQ